MAQLASAPALGFGNVDRFPNLFTILHMNICRRCNKNEAVTNKNLWCRPCKQAYDREYWAKTKSLRNDRKRLNAKQIRIRNSQFVWDYLAAHPCVDCGNNNPMVLTFDHLRDKIYNISDMKTNSLEKIREEIAKCEVRCANCHHIKTVTQFDWYKDIHRDIV